MTQVLVTGCLGYIGPILVKHLKAAGHRVIGLDMGLFLPQYATVPDWPDSVSFGDIRDGTGALAPVVVHLAGLSNDPMGEFAPKLTHDINEVGTLRLIRSMKRSRHVVISSCAVYGANSKVATEETEPNPLTAYARAKANVDEATADMPNVMTLRLGTVYGPSPGHRLDLVVNRMVYDAVRGNGISVQGSAWRPFVHVEDVAEAIVRAVESEATGVHNVVGQNLRIDTLAGQVQRATSAALRLIDVVDKRDYRAKTVHEPLLPRFRTVEESLADLIDFTFDLPGTPNRYVRLETLKRLVASGRLTTDLKEPIAA